ncbi:hypothetical protein P4123_29300 [Pseudomonas aeruginosa]|nr:hypothetical protein [Pseudomonas aeruginosa]
MVLGNNQRIEIAGAGAQASEGFQGVTLRADDLNAFGAARMVIGSTPAVLYGQGGNYVTFDITDGAQHRPAQWRRTGRTRGVPPGESAGEVDQP